ASTARSSRRQSRSTTSPGWARSAKSSSRDTTRSSASCPSRIDASRSDAALADCVLGPGLNRRCKLRFAASCASRKLDEDLVHGRLDVLGELESPLGDDLHGVELFEQRLG